MSIVDQGIGFLQTPVGIISAIMVVVVIGMVIYLFKFGDIASKGTVILFRPRDKRAEMIPIAKEEELVVYCKPKDGIPRRFVKGGNSWMINKKNFFLAVEGSGYTAVLDAANNREIPIIDFLRENLGEITFSKFTPAMIKKLTTSKYLVDITPTQIDVGSNLPRLSSEDLNAKNDKEMLDILAQATKSQKSKPDYILLIFAMLGGAGLILIVRALGWLKF
jgi:hypothetical protein